MKNRFGITLLLPLAAFCLHGQTYANDTAKSSSRYEGTSLCDAGDEIFSSCPTEKGKIISICGTAHKTPFVLYMIYGTKDKKIVSSPRKGKFPLSFDQIESYGSALHFSENGKQYIVYRTTGLRGDFEKRGFIERTVPDISTKEYSIIDDDVCKINPVTSKNILKSENYIVKARTSSTDNFDYDDRLTDLINEQ